MEIPMSRSSVLKSSQQPASYLKALTVFLTTTAGFLLGRTLLVSSWLGATKDAAAITKNNAKNANAMVTVDRGHADLTDQTAVVRGADFSGSPAKLNLVDFKELPLSPLKDEAKAAVQFDSKQWFPSPLPIVSLDRIWFALTVVDKKLSFFFTFLPGVAAEFIGADAHLQYVKEYASSLKEKLLPCPNGDIACHDSNARYIQSAQYMIATLLKGIELPAVDRDLDYKIAAEIKKQYQTEYEKHLEKYEKAQGLHSVDRGHYTVEYAPPTHPQIIPVIRAVGSNDNKQCVERHVAVPGYMSWSIYYNGWFRPDTLVAEGGYNYNKEARKPTVDVDPPKSTCTL